MRENFVWLADVWPLGEQGRELVHERRLIRSMALGVVK